MPLLWLRVSLACYGVGLIYVLIALGVNSKWLNRAALHAAYLGMIFEFVSLTESVLLSPQVALAAEHYAEPILALVIMAMFMVIYLIYKTTSPGIVVFPLVFLLTFVAAAGEQPFLSMVPSTRKDWLIAHIVLIFAGYAALILSFGTSLVYLIQEHALKAKRGSGILGRLPALQVLDEISFRSLIVGFPCMTLGLLAGLVVVEATYGRVQYGDPKILLSLIMWAVYLLLIYTRWSAGWRGKRAAYLATGAFAIAVIAWAANYFSAIHGFVRS